MKKSKRVTIVMYHYVRELNHSRYKDIKGLDFFLFREQIGYLKKHYQFITMEMLIDAFDNDTALPTKSVLLTFDDAYCDHFRYVFPLLNEQNLQGSFFPNVKAITEHIVLDVNKIHFILASVKDKSIILEKVKKKIRKYRKEYNLKSDLYYFEKLAHPSRYDSADVVFIKRILQVELEESIRKKITNELFEEFVGISEDTFSRELYMDIDQLKCMRRNGMYIGSHGYDHYYLSTLNRNDQEHEIKKSIQFLENVGCDPNSWTMCYPYGNYNETTIELLKKYNCKLALTIKPN